MTDIINVVTKILQSYTGLPDFIIEKVYDDTKESYLCCFDDGVIVQFTYPDDGFTAKLLGVAVYEMYLNKSQDYGMGTK